MKFEDKYHEQRYYKLLSRMKKNDCYHKAAVYLMALADLVPEDVFDFDADRVKHDGVFKGWQTSSTVKTTRLMYNLWNGWAYDEDNPDVVSRDYSVYFLFDNYQYAPYFYEAIRIGNGWSE